MRSPTDPWRHCTIHVRTYDLPLGFRARDLEEMLPDWYADEIHKTYRKVYQPRAISLEPRRVQVDGTTTTMQRWAAVYPHAGLVEIAHLLRVPYTAALEREDGVVPIDVDWKPDASDASTPHSIQWTLDMTYRDLTGVTVELETPRRDGFDHIVFVPASDLRSDAGEPGLYDGDIVFIETAKLVVQTTRCVDSFRDAGAYLALAGILLRGRHVVTRLEALIVDTAEGLLRRPADSGYIDPWKGVHVAQQLQAQAILTQSEVFGRRVPRHRFSASTHLAQIAADTLGVRPEESEALQNATAALQGLSASTFGIAVDRSQRRFAVGGLIFALVSIGFSSIAILDFVQASPPETRRWVYTALVAALVVAVIAFGCSLVVLERMFLRRRRASR